MPGKKGGRRTAVGGKAKAKYEVRGTRYEVRGTRYEVAKPGRGGWGWKWFCEVDASSAQGVCSPREG